jgi:inorganic phosphate transporter, PiT family
MPPTSFFVAAVALALAYANGTNDDYKGIATLWGGEILSYQSALAVGVGATLLGSLVSLHISGALLHSFEGQALLSHPLSGGQAAKFALATGAAASVVVIGASVLGLPVSTTHALLGAMVGAAISDGFQPYLPVLRQQFVQPLLLSPVVAIPLAASGCFLAVLKRPSASGSNSCLCVGNEICEFAAAPSASGASVLGAPILTVRVAEIAECERIYDRIALRLTNESALDWLHVLSAGAVSFARGVNDTPKIAALLLPTAATSMAGSVGIVGLAIALGGALSARRVAETMSHRITNLDRRLGLVANLSTAGIVLIASYLGLPVSTTHVACGSLFGVGASSRRVGWRTISEIALAWLLTLPVAALFAFALFRLLS